MEEQFSRTELLIGTKAMQLLRKAKVAVFGIGGVGSYTVEALARAGIGHLVLIDKDEVDMTNINRQIHAVHQTIGIPKVEVMKERILNICPSTIVETYPVFFLPETKEHIIDSSFDYIVDAVDTVTAKLEIITRAKEFKVPVISCMGTGNKLEPTMLEVADIAKTSVCPLAKVMRKELKQRGITNVKVVYSKEEPKRSIESQNPASISFVPSVAGLIIAKEVTMDIIKKG